MARYLSLTTLTRLEILGTLPVQKQVCSLNYLIQKPTVKRKVHTSFTPLLSKSKGNSGSKNDKKKTIDQLLDDLDVDDDVDDVKVGQPNRVVINSPVAKFMSQKVGGGGAKKDKGKSKQLVGVTYEEVCELLDVDEYWEGMDAILIEQQNHFAHQLTLRSASAIDELPVEFEGQMYPLREVADISKRDPKRVIIDTSSIPQATLSIMKTLQEKKNLNLNPQQEGTRIYIPIPKVTRETREKLVKTAQITLNDTKEKLRKLCNKTTNEVNNVTGNLKEDQVKGTNDVLRAIEGHFAVLAKEMTNQKQNDLMAK